MKNKEILLDVIGDVDEMYVPELIASKKKKHSLMYFALGGVSVATIAAGIMLLTGLNSKDRINSTYERVLSFFQNFGENNDNPMTEPEQLAVVRLDSDRAVPASAEQLEEYSTAIIVGTISEQLNTVREPSGLGMTYYQVEVESVLYGTLEENETAIRIWQPWWISMDGSQIETFSDLKPLQVGNRRIFALSYSETNGTYAISCDSDGCMPVPTSDLLNESLSDPEVLKVMEEEYNLYDGEDIRYGYYRDVLLRYRDQM